MEFHPVVNQVSGIFKAVQPFRLSEGMREQLEAHRLWTADEYEKALKHEAPESLKEALSRALQDIDKALMDDAEAFERVLVRLERAVGVSQ